ncbi:GNAT family N-acetyltransferase [Burkholderia multivorans]|uniref:GNAT family N-acetyltransferase n=1 Tax=Burkholderia multivorans TaxID=87883 RepID=UPI0030C832C8
MVGFRVRAAIDCERPTPGWLFAHPDHIGQGIGRALWTAVPTQAAARGIASFVIEADPNAPALYLSLGNPPEKAK